MATKKQAKARTLKTSVHVHEWVAANPDDPKGEHRIARTQVFAAGEELPEWAQAQVGDHVYEDSSSDDASDE